MDPTSCIRCREPTNNLRRYTWASRKKNIDISQIIIDELLQRDMTQQQFWPSHVECYKRTGSAITCVEDAGMALAHRNAGIWTLIGISTYGPSCKLPARYIQFSAYVPWAQDILYIKTKASGFTGFRRVGEFRSRSWERKKVALEEIDAIPFQKFENRMEFHLKRIDDDTLALHVGNLDGRIGECPPRQGYRPLYSEDGQFDVSDDGYGRVLYALSMHDLTAYKRVDCVVARVNCSKSSAVVLVYDKGYDQEDIGPLIQTIYEKPQEPESDGPKEKVPLKIIGLTEPYHKHYKILTSTVYFRFEFHGHATIQVELWGMLNKYSTTTTMFPWLTRDTTTTRSRAPITKHMRPGPGQNTEWRFKPDVNRRFEQETTRKLFWGQDNN